ncbi:MAG TPA: tetratricopeptide repeat protein [Bryobacterales bacterium]|nr:tetratricopeptide repeat protein [Bryobacterales bacterium]
MAAALAYLGLLAADEDPKQPAKAESIYRQALKIDPTCSEAHVGLARLHTNANRRADALREYQLGVEAHLDNALACHELGVFLFLENFAPTAAMWQDEIRCGQTLTRHNPDDRPAHHALAQVYEHFGRWAEAEHEYREVVRIGQTDEDSDVWVYTVHNDVARMLERQRRYPEAIREYEALIASEGPGEEEIAQAKARIEALKSAK